MKLFKISEYEILKRYSEKLKTYGAKSDKYVDSYVYKLIKYNQKVKKRSLKK